MPTPNTIPGEGTIIQIKISGAYTDVGTVEEIDGFEVAVEEVKKTHLQSVIHEYRPSLIPDPGTFSLKIQLDPNHAVHQALYANASVPGTIDDWKMIFVDGKTTPANATFLGFIKKYKVTGQKVEENLMAEIEVRLTSLPVMTAGIP